MKKVFIKIKNIIIENRNLIFNFQVIIIFLFITFFLYAHFINDYFFSDDFEWLSFGERIKEDPVNLFKLHVSSFYSPVVNLFFYLGQIIFPFRHDVYHLVMIGLHFINTVLVYFLCKKMLKNRIASFFAALFFCLNQYHYEALVWISAVMHLLTTFITLLSTLFYIKFIKSNKNIYLVVVYFLVILAFLTKESGIAAFVYIFAIYFFYHAKNFLKFANWKHLIPFFLTLSNILAWSYLWQRNTIWITKGIYKIDIYAYQKLINSIVQLFTIPLSDYPMGANIYNFVFVLVLFLFLFLFILFNKKALPGYLASLMMMVSGFLPAIFFFYGTWNDTAASRYAYLPTVGGALFIATVYTLFAKNKYTNFIGLCLFIGLSYFFITSNHQAILIKHQEYTTVQKQSRGMVESFQKHKDVIATKEAVVLLQSFPFYGNNYFIYMYKLIIDNNYKGEWIKSLDWDETIARYNNNRNAIFIWDNNKYEFNLVNSKHKIIINPAVKAIVNDKKVIKFIEENAIGITEKEIIKIPINMNLIYGNDKDTDGLENSFEEAIGTKKNKADSDDDGFIDILELKNNYSPLEGGSTKNVYNDNIIERYLGKVVLQVEKNGEAWYVNPDDRKRYFLGSLENAFVQLNFLKLLD